MTEINTTECQVSGMSCQHCVKAVTQALQAQDPQAQVSVDLAQGKVTVRSHLSAQAVRQAIGDEGYGVSL